jgi:hypothetical protein
MIFCSGCREIHTLQNHECFVLYVVGIDDLVVEKKFYDPKNHHELVVGRCEFQVHATGVLLHLDLNLMVLCQLKSVDVGCMWLSTTQYTHEHG